MLSSLIPLALGAGMVAAVNPCGFALLPAYLSLLVVGDDSPTRARAVARALKLTASMTLGFAAVFAGFGLVIAPVASGLQQHLPWFTVVLGASLALLGVWLLLGRELKLPSLRRGSTRAAKPLTGSLGSMFGFGAGYAAASLTCTIAPFLAVVVAGFRSESALTGIVLFLAYAAGMGLVVGTVAVATALAQGRLISGMRRAGRWVPRVSGALLLVAGSYVAYYGAWELRVLAGGATEDPVIDAAASLQRAMADAVAAPGATGWVLIAAVVAGAAWLLGRRRGRTDALAAADR